MCMHCMDRCACMWENIFRTNHLKWESKQLKNNDMKHVCTFHSHLMSLPSPERTSLWTFLGWMVIADERYLKNYTEYTNSFCCLSCCPLCSFGCKKIKFKICLNSDIVKLIKVSCLTRKAHYLTYWLCIILLSMTRLLRRTHILCVTL